MRNTYIRAIAWTTVAIGMIVIFVNPDTLENWGDNRTKTILLAVLFLVGFGTDLSLRVVEKTKNKSMIRDEKLKDIQSIGFVVFTLYVFLLTIIIYVYYEGAGTVPVGWIWFIAYSSIVVANLSVNYTSIVLNRKRADKKEAD